MPVCSTCGTDNPEVARFCLACGTQLVGAEAPRTERKIVSVLFGDLVGSTAQAEQLDPEDVRALLSRFHDLARGELERYGGTVEKFIGDAVMALFGAPVAHEDDPERAVRAGLSLRDALTESGELQVRIGITTGEALVSLTARPDAGEGMAAGDVVNTGARLQAAAPTNGVLVDETTYRATSRLIAYREHRPLDAKGKSAPVRVWEAIEPKARFGVDVRQIGSTPLVGREAELRTLVEALDRVRREREPQLVTLVGEPGIGKSRLVWELFQHVGSSGELTFWRQGRSLPYGKGISFWALGEMVKAQAGVLETDSATAVEEKLRDAVSALLTHDESTASWIERHLRPLVGLDAEAALEVDGRSEAFAAWRRFLEALAEQRPLVLVFEDLHFADEGLLEFVDYLVDWARGVPILAVATARPELLSIRSDWAGGKSNAATISLNPLSDEETARLVHALLARPVLDAGLREAVLARAGGNPLYAEEFARLVEERGADGELPLPETVQGLIAARIDALPTPEKDLLQAAAVIGKVFWLGAAATLTETGRWAAEETLHSLERKEFVRRERRSSVAGETEYAIRHLLVRDVAYVQLPRRARAEKHRLAAAWIDSLGRREDHSEMLAHHHLSVLDLSRSIGEPPVDATGARTALREAGDRALALSATSAAARYYAEALALWPDDDPERPDLLYALASSRHFAADELAQNTLEEAREAMLAAHRPERAAQLETLLAELFWYRGDRERCDRHLEEARRLVDPRPPSPEKAHVLSQTARYQALAGRCEESIRVGGEALAMAEALGLDELRAHALNNLGIAKGSLDDPAGLRDLERSVELALAARSPEATRALNNLSAMTWALGDLPSAQRWIEDAVRVSEELGPGLAAAAVRSARVAGLFALGDWDEAFSRADERLETPSGARDDNLRRRRARARLDRGDVEGALDDARLCVESGRARKDPQSRVPTLGLAARLHAEAGFPEQARSLADELLRDTVRTPAWTLVDLCWVAPQLERGEGVRKLLERAPPANPFRRAGLALLDRDYVAAADSFAEIGEVDSEAVARLHAAERLAASGQRDDAAEQLRRAVAFFESVGAQRRLAQARRLTDAAASGTPAGTAKLRVDRAGGQV